MSPVGETSSWNKPDMAGRIDWPGGHPLGQAVAGRTGDITTGAVVTAERRHPLWRHQCRPERTCRCIRAMCDSVRFLCGRGRGLPALARSGTRAFVGRPATRTWVGRRVLQLRVSAAGADGRRPCCANSRSQPTRASRRRTSQQSAAGSPTRQRSTVAPGPASATPAIAPYLAPLCQVPRDITQAAIRTGSPGLSCCSGISRTSTMRARSKPLNAVRKQPP